MDIFVNSDFRVNRVITPKVSLPASITMRSTLPGSVYFHDQQFAVITGVDHTQSTNYQIMPSLDDNIFLYTFGDKPGVLTVQGIAFGQVCDNGEVGLDGILEYYSKNKISQRAANNEIPQIQITMSRTSIVGFLVDCSVKMTDPATRISAFTLSLRVV